VVDAVAGRENMATTRRCLAQNPANLAINLLLGTVCQQLAAVEIAKEDESLPIFLFDFGNVYSCSRLKAMETVDTDLINQDIKDRHHVSIHVFDKGNPSHVTLLHNALEVGSKELAKMPGDMRGPAL